MILNSKNLGQDNHPKQSISIDVNVNAIETMLINGIDQISNYQKKNPDIYTILINMKKYLLIIKKTI